MFVFILLQCLLISLVSSVSKYPILIVVSYDAFRHNFFEKNATPQMQRIRLEGSYADYLLNVFPTKTFPNHHSIATGLYPEEHGVVGNSFYDPKLQQIINIGQEMFDYNETIEPIWRLNERLGDGRYSGVMMWPGGCFSYQNQMPTYYRKFDMKFQWKERIDTIMTWIENPERPANLIMLYFEQPDVTGHIYGPESDFVVRSLQELDNVTHYLEQKLFEKQLTDKVHVIHLSDHGLSTVTPSNFIDLTKFLPNGTYQIADSSPGLHIIPNKGCFDETYAALKRAEREVGHFTVYKKSEMLERWHYKNNRRAPPILVLADDTYGFQDLAKSAQDYSSQFNFKVTNSTQFGVHGYDNHLPSMHPFFMARGPKIKRNFRIPPFNTVDLYGLFCAILEIAPPPTNGTLANVHDMLVSEEEGGPSSASPMVIAVVVGVVLSILLIVCTAVVTIIVIKRQQNITTVAALNKRFPQTFTHSNIEAQHLLEPEEA